MTQFIEELKNIRTNPRKMSEKWLSSNGYLAKIQTETDGEEFARFNIKEKIDFLIHGSQRLYCHCGNLLKLNQKNCSAKCTGKNPVNRAKTAQRQKENAKERFDKTKKTLLEKYGVTHNMQVASTKEKTASVKAQNRLQKLQSLIASFGVEAKYLDKDYLQNNIASYASMSELVSAHFGSVPCNLVERLLYKTYHWYLLFKPGEEQFENILVTKPRNAVYLNRYIKFIKTRSDRVLDSGVYKEVHHICPKSASLFPQFRNLYDNPWNSLELTLREHIHAHLLLSRAYPGKHQLYAFQMMVNSSKTISGKARRKVDKRTIEKYRRFVDIL